MNEKERKSKWEKENNIKIAIISQNNQKKITLAELIKQSQKISKDDIEK